MKEVKPSKKPLAIYYAIVLCVLLVLDLVLVPWFSQRRIKEVDYGTFMTMTEEQNIGRVDIESNQIIFTDKDDPGLQDRPDERPRPDPAAVRRRCQLLQRDRGAGFAVGQLSAVVRAAHSAVQLHRQPDEQKADGKGRRRPGCHDVRRRG